MMNYNICIYIYIMKRYLYILIIIFIFLCVCLFCKGCIDIYDGFSVGGQVSDGINISQNLILSSSGSGFSCKMPKPSIDYKIICKGPGSSVTKYLEGCNCSNASKVNCSFTCLNSSGETVKYNKDEKIYNCRLNNSTLIRGCGENSIGFTSDITATCIDDPCDPNPCQNGGTCSNDNGNAKCECPDGYTGDNCENKEECPSQPQPIGDIIDKSNSRVFNINNYTNKELLLFMVLDQGNIDFLPNNFNNILQSNKTNINMEENNSQWVIGIIERGTFNCPKTTSFEFPLSDKCGYNPGIINCFKSLTMYIQDNNKIYTKLPTPTGFKIELTAEQGNPENVDYYDLSAIFDGTCGSHMNKLSTNYCDVNATNTATFDPNGNQNKCIKNDYAYNPKQQGVIIPQQYVGGITDPNIIDNTYVCGLPNSNNNFQGAKTNNYEQNELNTCTSETKKTNGVLCSYNQCKNFKESTIKKAMEDAWKCSLIQGKICSDSNCSSINNDNIPKFNMKFRIEEEGKNNGLCTNPSLMFNSNVPTHSKSYVGNGIDNILNWDINKLLDLQIIDEEMHNKSEYFSAYIYPYNEELFNANPTCQLKPYENKYQYINILDSISNIIKDPANNKYKYKKYIIKNEKIKAPQYHIDISDFGKVPDKLLI